MALTYTETIRSTQTETRERTVTAPKRWGMFSSNGNRSLQNKAEKLVAEIEVAKTYVQKIAAFEKFLKSYRKMSSYKTMREASDTAVRETVWHFMLQVGKAANVSEGTLDDLWDSTY